WCPNAGTFVSDEQQRPTLVDGLRYVRRSGTPASRVPR
ncbi:MAG: hypothetical protein AVDCRST_MAG59-2734, partial [uncultured Thermomicrobiales bacterium]